MTYSDTEISTQDGQPVALYTLRWDKTYWRYNSSDIEITRSELVDGVPTDVVYIPVGISDEGFVQGGSDVNNMTVDIPRDLPIVDLFNGTPPSESIWLTIRRIHDDGTEDAPIYWIGLVSNVVGKDAASAQIIGIPLAATFKRAGLRLCWSRGCPHTVYDSQCRLAPADFAFDTTIKAVTGNGFTVAAIDTDVGSNGYRGGYVSWEANDDGTIERRTIEEVLPDVIILTVPYKTFQIFGTTDRLTALTAVKIYPGCDLTPGTCQDRFDNLVNHGGFEFMSGKSPFDGTPVF